MVKAWKWGDKLMGLWNKGNGRLIDTTDGVIVILR